MYISRHWGDLLHIAVGGVRRVRECLATEAIENQVQEDALTVLTRSTGIACHSAKITQCERCDT